MQNRRKPIAGARWFSALGAVSMLALVWQCQARDADTQPTVGTAHKALEQIAAQKRSVPSSEPQASFAGTVRDTTGVPVANAEVCASCSTCGSADLPPLACTRTDDSGTYALTAPGCASVSISASAEGFEPGQPSDTVLACRSKGRSNIDIVLVAGGARVVGRVLDALGGPIPFARVLLDHTPSWSEHQAFETRTDEEGVFRFFGAHGHMQVRAEAEGYASRSEAVVAPVEDLELQLTPGSTVRGVVLRADTNEPIEGARVSARPEGHLAIAASALTDEDGAFLLTGLEPISYVLSAEHAGWRGVTPTPIELHLAGVAEGVVISASPGVLVTGRVEASDAREASVCSGGVVQLDPLVERAEANAPLAFGVSASVDHEGTVSFLGVTRGRYLVNVRCPEKVLARGPTTLDVQGEPLRVTWTIRAGATLRVSVVDGGGKPVPHAEALLVSAPKAEPNVRTARQLRMDARGQVEMVGELTPGIYAVQPPTGSEGASASVTLDERNAAAALTLHLHGSAYIELRARDEEGRGVTGLHVSAEAEGAPAERDAPPGHAYATALGDGNYRVGPIRAGSYRLRVEDGDNSLLKVDGVTSGRVTVRNGSKLALDVRVDRGGRVAGTVLDSEGAPVGDAWVTANTEELSPLVHRTMEYAQQRRALTDAEGNFELSKLQPGALYTLRVKQPFENAATRHSVREGDTVKIVMPAVSTLSGVLRDEKGQLVPHATVRMQHDETGSARATTTSAAGTFSLARVPAGEVQLMAGEPGQSFAYAELKVVAGAPPPEVMLTYVGPQLGRNASGDGEPAAAAAAPAAGEPEGAAPPHGG